MTKQQTFKRRVRARMEKTGERYAAARNSILAQSNEPTTRTWVSPPEMSDDAIRDATGKGWNDWCDLIDAHPSANEGHTAVAAWLQRSGQADVWWSQSITGGWERITGRRLPGEMPDGTFTANKSRTVEIDGSMLRALLLDEVGRGDLFPGHATELRSAATSKAIRLAMPEGVAVISIEGKSGGRERVAIQHTKLADGVAADAWRYYWDDWLEALEG